MARDVTLKVYPFSELNEKAQQKVIDWFAGVDDTLSSRLEDLFASTAEAMHVSDVDFSWSLSWSQGDGVSFQTKDWRTPSDELLKATGDFDKWKGLRDTLGVTYKITRFNTRYSHKSTMIVELDHESPSDREAESLNEMEGSLLNYFRSVAQKLEEVGYKEIEYVRSKEYVQEGCDADDYEFFADGRLYTGE